MSKLIIALYITATSLALILLKLGTKTGAPVSYANHKLSFNLSWYVIAGIMLYCVSFLIYMLLISRYDLGYIIPLTTAFVYIVIFAASFVIFKEAFTVLKTVGIALIVVGLVLLNLKN